MRVNGNSIFERERKSQSIWVRSSIRHSHASEVFEEEEQKKKAPGQDRLVSKREGNSFSLLEDQFLTPDDLFSKGIKLALNSKTDGGNKMDEEVPLKAGFELKLKLRKKSDLRSIHEMNYTSYDLKPHLQENDVKFPLAWCKERDLCYIGTDTEVYCFMEEKKMYKSFSSDNKVLAIASLRKNHYALADMSNNILVRDLQKNVTQRKLYCKKSWYNDRVDCLSTPIESERCTELIAGIKARFELYDLSQKIGCVVSRPMQPYYAFIKDIQQFGIHGVATLSIQNELTFWDKRNLDNHVSRADCLNPIFVTEKFVFNPQNSRICLILTPQSQLILYDVTANNVIDQRYIEASIVNLTWHACGKITLIHTCPKPGISLWRINSKNKIELVEEHTSEHDVDTEIFSGSGNTNGERVVMLGDFHFDSPFESHPNVGFLTV